MNKLLMLPIALMVSVAGCKSTSSTDQPDSAAPKATSRSENVNSEPKAGQKAEGDQKIEALPESPADPSLRIATFAGGCFWCMEPPFDKTAGVERTIVGYTGGDQAHPTYREVGSGATDHAESIRVYYDPGEVTYDHLLDVYWRNINPTQADGQFVDIGEQYRTVIFYHNDRQKELAEASKEELARSGRFGDAEIVTDIEPAQTFWKAEDYHQNFYKKSPRRYHSYHSGSGRDEFIERIWGDDALPADNPD